MRLFNYWRSSSSYRVRVVLAHKQLPYDYVAVSLLKGEQREAAHLGRNPWGSVPVLEVEEDGAPLLIPQSVAIAEYLEERYPEHPIFPASRSARAQVRALVETVNSGIQPYHNLSTLNYLKDELGADQKAWAVHFIRRGLGALEKLAARSAGRFLVGDDFTWADCCLVPQLFGARRVDVSPDEYPLLARIEQTCLSLPAVQAARPELQPDATPTA
jgi:maleylpyruvate isomerase